MRNSGILFVNKPRDWTSNDAIQRIKKTIHPQKIGHSGTLDPLATGLLCVGLNAATKLLTFTHLLKKEYIVEAKFGYNSDTYDCTGNLDKVKDVEVSQKQLKSACDHFLGEIEQIPPAFSAIKIKGTPAYKLARRGEQFEIKARKVNVFKIEILDLNYPAFVLRILCGTGTYIRSIIHDLGKFFNSGAVMTGLIRSQIGDFTLENAIEIEDKAHINDQYNKHLISPEEIISFLPQLKIRDDFPLEHGVPLKINNVIDYKGDIQSEYAYILKKNQKKHILAIVKRKKNHYSKILEYPWDYERIIQYENDFTSH